MRSEDESPSVWSAARRFGTIGEAMKKHKDHRERRHRLAGAMWRLLESVATSVPVSAGLETLSFAKRELSASRLRRSIEGASAGRD